MSEPADDMAAGRDWTGWQVGRRWWLVMRCFFCERPLLFGPFHSPLTLAAAAEAAEGAVCHTCAVVLGL